MGCWCSPAQNPSRTAVRVAQAMQQADPLEVQRNVVDDRGQLPALSDVERAFHAEGNQGIRRLLAASEHPAQVQLTARYPLADGSVVVLTNQQGEYRVRLAPLLAACPRTVLEALSGFRVAVESRPGPASAAPLTKHARTAVEREDQAIISGLRYLDELEIAQAAAAAQVTLPTGHIVSLRFQLGCWLIDEVS